MPKAGRRLAEGVDIQKYRKLANDREPAQGGGKMYKSWEIYNRSLLLKEMDKGQGEGKKH